MFEDFKDIDKDLTFEIVSNGWILRVSGRNDDDEWIDLSCVFSSRADFVAALVKLEQKVKGEPRVI
jgi:hypothetical protein